MSLPKSRYLNHLNAFGSIVSESIKEHQSNPKSTFASFLHKKGGRTPLFQLQGLARIDAKISMHKELAESWLDQFKEIEDALGKYDYWITMIENNQKWKFPSQINTYFINNTYYYIGILEYLLTKYGWISKHGNNYTYLETALINFEKSTKKVKWYKSGKEKKKLVVFYRDELMNLNQKIESEEIDLNLLEEGIHEFRRKLRWIGIYSSALRGKVLIAAPVKGDVLSKFVTKKNTEISFNIIQSNPEEKAVIKFLPGGYYAMSELINKIGDIKDTGICSAEMLVVGKMFGLSPIKIQKLLGDDYLSQTSVVKSNKALIVNYVKKEKILLHMADYLDAQNHSS